MCPDIISPELALSLPKSLYSWNMARPYAPDYISEHHLLPSLRPSPLHLPEELLAYYPCVKNRKWREQATLAILKCPSTFANDAASIHKSWIQKNYRFLEGFLSNMGDFELRVHGLRLLERALTLPAEDGSGASLRHKKPLDQEIPKEDFEGFMAAVFDSCRPFDHHLVQVAYLQALSRMIYEPCTYCWLFHERTRAAVFRGIGSTSPELHGLSIRFLVRLYGRLPEETDRVFDFVHLAIESAHSPFILRQLVDTNATLPYGIGQHFDLLEVLIAHLERAEVGQIEESIELISTLVRHVPADSGRLQSFSNAFQNRIWTPGLLILWLSLQTTIPWHNRALEAPKALCFFGLSLICKSLEIEPLPAQFPPSFPIPIDVDIHALDKHLVAVFWKAVFSQAALAPQDAALQTYLDRILDAYLKRSASGGNAMAALKHLKHSATFGHSKDHELNLGFVLEHLDVAKLGVADIMWLVDHCTYLPSKKTSFLKRPNANLLKDLYRRIASTIYGDACDAVTRIDLLSRIVLSSSGEFALQLIQQLLQQLGNAASFQLPAITAVFKRNLGLADGPAVCFFFENCHRLLEEALVSKGEDIDSRLDLIDIGLLYVKSSPENGRITPFELVQSCSRLIDSFWPESTRYARTRMVSQLSSCLVLCRVSIDNVPEQHSGPEMNLQGQEAALCHARRVNFRMRTELASVLDEDPVKDLLNEAVYLLGHPEHADDSDCECLCE